MKLEGTNTIPTLAAGEIKVTLMQTTEDEVNRITQTISTLFEQGVFNLKNGEVTLGFDPNGKLQNIRMKAVKWSTRGPVTGRVAIYEKAIVQAVN